MGLFVIFIIRGSYALHYITISSYWEHVQDARDMVFLPCMHGQLLQVIWYGDQPAAVPTRQYFIDIAIQGSVVCYHWNCMSRLSSLTMVSIWSLEASPTMAQLQQLRTPSSGAQLSTNLRLLIVMLQTIQASCRRILNDLSYL